MFIVKEALDHIKCLSHYRAGEGGVRGREFKKKIMAGV